MSVASTQSEVPLAYKAIKQRLLRHLRSRYRVGSRLPPIPELAVSLGTGQVNTYRAVRELVKEGILASRRKHGSFVARVPSLADIQSRTKARPPVKHRVTLVHDAAYHSHSLTFIGDMVRGFREAMVEAGIEPLEHLTDMMNPVIPGPDEVDAVVLFNPNSRPKITLQGKQVGLVVHTAVQAPINNTGRYDVVGVEQEQGGQLAGELLRDLGRPGICFIGAKQRVEPGSDSLARRAYDNISSPRLAGFEVGLGQMIPASHRLYTFGYCVNAGARVVPRFLEINPMPRAVFCATDEIATGFIAGMLAHRLIPGRDYVIVGFDGQQAGQALDSETGALTSVCVPTRAMGRRGAQLLLERLDDPDQPIRRFQLGCTLFRGNTA